MLSALVLVVSVFTAAPPRFEAEFIFPPNAKHNHGSSIVETPNGGLLACWFHGSGERKSDDVIVQGARKKPGATEWSEVFVMADTPDLPDCNPVLFVDPRGTLWLFWIAVQDNQWGGSLLKYRTSTDYEGAGPPRWNWQDVIHTRPTDLEAQFLAALEKAGPMVERYSAFMPDLPEEIERGKAAAQDKRARRLGWMTRTPPIMISDTRMVLGLYSDVFNCGLAAITEDWGETWTFSEPIMSPDPALLGNIQPAIVQRKNGDLVAYMRDNGIPKKVRTATSSDDGHTWSDVTALDIRDSGASVAALRLQSGDWLLVNNSLLNGRHELVARLSSDEGATWPISRHIEKTEREQGSYSYPCLIQAKDGSIHLSYTFKETGTDGSTIKHVRFDEQWIASGE